jgi:aminoglycoside 6'-N-acetyltransferase
MAEISFRLIARTDFPLVSSWLATPHVARWWAADASLAAIEAEYGGCIDGTEPCEMFIAHDGSAPVGLIQRFRFDAYPQYIDELAHIIAVPDHVFSVDYFIGPIGALHQGLGGAMIHAFARKLWSDEEVATCIIMPTHASNRASWRSLERAGFHRVASGELAPDNPIDDRVHFIYRLDRPSGSPKQHG